MKKWSLWAALVCGVLLSIALVQAAGTLFTDTGPMRRIGISDGTDDVCVDSSGNLCVTSGGAQQTVVTLLNAVTATGAGSITTLSTGMEIHTWTTVVTGAPSAVSINLEGSIDGTNFFTLDNETTTTSDMQHVVNKAVTSIRANLATLTGGTAPTVTVKYIGKTGG